MQRKGFHKGLYDTACSTGSVSHSATGHRYSAQFCYNSILGMKVCCMPVQQTVLLLQHREACWSLSVMLLQTAGGDDLHTEYGGFAKGCHSQWHSSPHMLTSPTCTCSLRCQVPRIAFIMSIQRSWPLPSSTKLADTTFAVQSGTC